MRAKVIYTDNSGASRNATSAAVPVSSPSNIADFRVIPGDGNVALSWSMPRNESAPDPSRWRFLRHPSVYGGEWQDATLEYNAYLRQDQIRGFHVVEGLANGATYTFHVGALHPSDEDKLHLLSAGLSAIPQAEAAPTGQTVPADWPLIPRLHGHAQVGPGESFRLMLLTSSKVPAVSGDIRYYNTLAQMDAARNADLVNSDGNHFSGEFRALVSTGQVDARDNTATTGRGVPIYYLGGEKVADGYADFYDGSWDYPACGYDETGEWLCWDLAWTGSQDDGTKDPIYHVGYPPANTTRYASVPGYDTLSGGVMSAERCLPTYQFECEGAPQQYHHLYVLSPVLTVAPAN